MSDILRARLCGGLPLGLLVLLGLCNGISASLGATLTATKNPIYVPYGQNTGTTSFNWDATDFFQAGGYTGIQIRAGSSTGNIVCSGGSATGSCGSASVTGSQTFYLMAVRYNNTTVQAATANVSVVDAVPLVNIDTPQNGSSYISPVNFGGWAVDHVYPISYVQVSIDGVNKGNVSYGGNRQDVCNAYPQAKSCPNVGFNYYFDPAFLSSGSHTVTFTAVDTNGDSASATKTFTTTQATTGINIDAPSQTQKPLILGATTLAGWALDTGDSITGVTVAVNGINQGNATYGGYRPDVCTNYGNYPGCANSGWSMNFDTAKVNGGAGGQYPMSATAYTSDGRQTTFNGVINIQAAITNIDIDTPQSGGSYLGYQHFGGWVVDNANTITSVTVTVDSTTYTASYGGSRPDVCSSGAAPGCPNVGWNLGFDTTPLASGTHSLTVTAVTSDGRTTPSRPVTFSVPQRITQVGIDWPDAQQAITGTQNFAGWAVDNASTIASVSLAVDGANIGTAVYGGNRPDVCTALGTQPGCPNVGWNLSVNTAQFSNGLHTLTAVATTSDGRTNTPPASMTFYSANPNPATPNSALAPTSPKKEYIRANGHVIAVENKP